MFNSVPYKTGKTYVGRFQTVRYGDRVKLRSNAVEQLTDIPLKNTEKSTNKAN